MPAEMGVAARPCKCDGRSWAAHRRRRKVNAIHAGACHETDPSPAADRPAARAGAGPGADCRSDRHPHHHHRGPRAGGTAAASGPPAAPGAAVTAAGATDQIHRSGPDCTHPGAEAGRQGLRPQWTHRPRCAPGRSEPRVRFAHRPLLRQRAAGRRPADPLAPA
ncbi:hypothetical protein G6F65_021662 [Rhizopus arrhizus]|nr:hypothetical protein G6F65_021662 [Rhizopus arrhizus]